MCLAAIIAENNAMLKVMLAALLHSFSSHAHHSPPMSSPNGEAPSGKVGMISCLEVAHSPADGSRCSWRISTSYGFGTQLASSEGPSVLFTQP